MIENEDIRGEEALAGLLVKTAGIVAAALGGAEVLLAADLGPDLGIGLDGEIREGAVLCLEAPLPDAIELGDLRGREEL